MEEIEKKIDEELQGFAASGSHRKFRCGFDIQINF